MKKAILQVADSGPAESLILMLRAVGYECYYPSDALKGKLRAAGCDTVVDIRGLVENWGYERPLSLPEASVEDMASADLYVDVKAHRNGPKVWSWWPRLQARTLWYRINGTAPERVPGCGDEITPPCPVLTPDLWYAEPGPWFGLAYACWPPFYRFDEYYPVRGRPLAEPTHLEWAGREAPLCLIHNLDGWGYGALTNPLRGMGVRCYGVRSPDGLVPHTRIPNLLSKAHCMVHLKSNDAPGYALYEALAAGCPIVCTRRLIWRCKMESLLEPGETCLVFDRETHEELTPADVAECVSEVREALERLRSPAENRRIGMAGRERLSRLMWSERRASDVQSLADFMGRMFP